MILINELQRGNLVRMAGLYLVAASLVVQVAETLLPVFEVTGWVMKRRVVVLAIGLVAALGVLSGFRAGARAFQSRYRRGASRVHRDAARGSGAAGDDGDDDRLPCSPPITHAVAPS